MWVAAVVVFCICIISYPGEVGSVNGGRGWPVFLFWVAVLSGIIVAARVL
jgi:hypothetical protein